MSPEVVFRDSGSGISSAKSRVKFGETSFSGSEFDMDSRSLLKNDILSRNKGLSAFTLNDDRQNKSDFTNQFKYQGSKSTKLGPIEQNFLTFNVILIKKILCV